MLKEVSLFQQGNNLLDRRGMLATFKSKSLDLLGSSRISARLAAAAAAAAGSSSSSGTAVTTDSTAAAARNADRRRRVFRRHKKANSATGSYEDSAGSQSRSSSIESNQSSCGGGGTQQSCGHAIHRGLESALKASTLFAWSSVEHASTLQHQVMPASQPSFIESECESFSLGSATALSVSHPHEMALSPTAQWDLFGADALLSENIFTEHFPIATASAYVGC